MYNNGDLKRKDNTLQFTAYDGEKRDIPIERISDIYVMSEILSIRHFLIIYRSMEYLYISLIIIIIIQEVFIQRMEIQQVSCWLSRLNIMWIMIRDWILP